MEEKFEYKENTDVIETTAEETDVSESGGIDIVGMVLLGLAIIGGGWIIMLIVKGIKKIISIVKDKVQKDKPVETTAAVKDETVHESEKVIVPEENVEVVETK